MTEAVNDGLACARKNAAGKRISVSNLEQCKKGTVRNITHYLTLMQGLTNFLTMKKLSGVERLKVQVMIPQFLMDNPESMCHIQMRMNDIGLSSTEIDQIIECTSKE